MDGVCSCGVGYTGAACRHLSCSGKALQAPVHSKEVGDHLCQIARGKTRGMEFYADLVAIPSEAKYDE